MRAILSYLLAIVVVVLVIWAARVLPARLGEAWRESRDLEQVASTLQDCQATFAAEARRAVGTAEAEIARLGRAGPQALDDAERGLWRKREAAKGRVLDESGLVRAALGGDADAITASYRARHVEIPLADRALAVVAARRSDLRALNGLNARIAAYNRRATAQRARRAEAVGLERESRAQWRNPVCRRLVVPGLCNKVRELASLNDRIRDEAGALKRDRRAIETLRQTVQGTIGGIQAGGDPVKRATDAFAREARVRGEAASEHVINTARRELARSGLYAVGLVTVAFLAGPLVRAIAFLFLAPIAKRARPLRLLSRGAPSRIAAAGEVVEVAVGPTINLWLREGAQGGGVGTGARTVARPLGRRVFTARGAGLVGVQLLCRNAPDLVAVAPFGDAATDIAAVEVPPGGAVAFHPAALVGAATPRGAGLAVARLSRWRDARSWATLRFHHYVFAGPGTLLLQGRRGIRRREAGGGGWAGDARLTIAHDAHLARNVRRRGSLWRFIRGRQVLFDESFAGDGGVYVEQLPSRAAAAGPAGNLLRRIGDAILKAAGL